MPPAARPAFERRRAKPRSAAADRSERDRSGWAERAVERTRRDGVRVVDASLARAGRRACRGGGSGDQEERRAAVASGLAASCAAGGMDAVVIACRCGSVRVRGQRMVQARSVGVRVRRSRHLVVAVVTRGSAGHGDACERGLDRKRRQEREQQQVPHRFHGGDYRRAHTARSCGGSETCLRHCPAPEAALIPVGRPCEVTASSRRGRSAPTCRRAPCLRGSRRRIPRAPRSSSR